MWASGWCAGTGVVCGAYEIARGHYWTAIVLIVLNGLFAILNYRLGKERYDLDIKIAVLKSKIDELLTTEGKNE